MKPATDEWVLKAEGDFRTARREFQASDGPNFDAACFHAQQCAEKYLKARLTEAGVEFSKIHDLEALLNQLLPIEPSSPPRYAQEPVAYIMVYRYNTVLGAEMVSKHSRREGRFTYADYLTWPEDERWELIEGKAWAMSPSPGESHQRISMNLALKIGNFLSGKPCRVYTAPFDVVLSNQDVVQPDIIVVCDRAKITATHVAGAPDLVVEILSPSTGSKDKREKLYLYERHGVREYLIIHPEERFAEQFVYDSKDGKFGRPVIIPASETYKSAVLESMEIGLKEVFE